MSIILFKKCSFPLLHYLLRSRDETGLAVVGIPIVLYQYGEKKG